MSSSLPIGNPSILRKAAGSFSFFHATYPTIEELPSCIVGWERQPQALDWRFYASIRIGMEQVVGLHRHISLPLRVLTFAADLLDSKGRPFSKEALSKYISKAWSSWITVSGTRFAI